MLRRLKLLSGKNLQEQKKTDVDVFISEEKNFFSCVPLSFLIRSKLL